MPDALQHPHPQQLPMSQMPQGQMLQQGQMPQGQMPQGQMPQGQMPMQPLGRWMPGIQYIFQTSSRQLSTMLHMGSSAQDGVNARCHGSDGSRPSELQCLPTLLSFVKFFVTFLTCEVPYSKPWKPWSIPLENTAKHFLNEFWIPLFASTSEHRPRCPVHGLWGIDTFARTSGATAGPRSQVGDTWTRGPPREPKTNRTFEKEKTFEKNKT